MRLFLVLTLFLYSFLCLGMNTRVLRKSPVSPSMYYNVLCSGPRPTYTPLECFAKFGRWPVNMHSSYSYSLWDLASIDSDMLPDLFRRCGSPSLGDIRGKTLNGIIMKVVGWNIGQALLEAYVGHSSGLKSQLVTFRKYFHPHDIDGASGINYWPVKKEWSLPMKAYTAESPFDSSMQSLHIDYNIPQNTRVTVRPLLDEIVQIPETKLYLGRMYFRVLGHPTFFLWFGLEMENNYNIMAI